MIRAIIFDLGGVILTHKVEVTIKILAEVFKIDESETLDLFKELEDDWVKGKISAKYLAGIFKKKFKSKRPLSNVIKYWVKLYEERTELNRELMAIIDELRKKYKIYLMTNTTDIHHKLNSTRGIFEHFDKVFASFIVGKRKPDDDFYKHLLDQIKLKPRECIFVDDRKENLDAPKQLGMKTVLFKNNKNLIKDLEKFGSLITF